jgi:threonine dehydrogenase-like Zn-dependent dehydrogenase
MLNGHAPSGDDLEAMTDSTSLNGTGRVIAREVRPDLVDHVACGHFDLQAVVTQTLPFSVAAEAIDARDIKKF